MIAAGIYELGWVFFECTYSCVSVFDWVITAQTVVFLFVFACLHVFACAYQTYALINQHLLLSSVELLCILPHAGLQRQVGLSV